MTTGKPFGNRREFSLTNSSVAAVNGTVVSTVTTTRAPTTRSSITATAASTYIPAPTQTATGTTPDCYEWYIAQSDDSCADVAKEYGLTLAEFIALNTNVDMSCNGFWVDYAYCVDGVVLASTTTTSSVATTTSATSVTTPTPTQAGMASSCTAFYEAVANDGCYDIAQTHGITLDQFYAWNPAVGDDCGQLWPNYWYCVSVA